MKKIFIIAGEASGDLLGSKLIAELKSQNPQSEFIGVGGKLMKEQGLTSIFPMEDLSVMGLFEILPHLPKLIKRINFTAAEILRQQPDVVITVDSPDFCFRVIKKIQSEKNIKKVHLLAGQKKFLSFMICFWQFFLLSLHILRNMV
jgi:lipid-A-disaccharide synthase